MIVLRTKIAPEHKETLRRLSSFEETLKGKAIRKGLDVASKPILEAMKQFAPEDRGLLRRAIGRSKLSARQVDRLGLFQRTGGSARASNVAVLIGPNKRVDGRRRAGVANILEGGTAPHTIRPRRGGRAIRLGAPVRGVGFAKAVRHPGIRPRRFMERAQRVGEAGFEARFFQGLAGHLDRI